MTGDMIGTSVLTLSSTSYCTEGFVHVTVRSMHGLALRMISRKFPIMRKLPCSVVAGHSGNGQKMALS